ncbi:MAG TPA: hydrogenase expression/formation protein HypE [Ignavibacteriaceae bacterium]|nr:hydrogenase expression/formation protein HypE [Ignavibacteriaceae bacterium]
MDCPIPKNEFDKILLAHGSGGSLTSKLIQEVFIKSFNNDLLAKEHDGAVFNLNGMKLAFTTDSFVVNPIFFPGGNIGELAVYGTVNDLAMCGAKPIYLSASFILEEGFDIKSLGLITESMQSAAERCNVQIVTGDTKVVEKGKGDKIFINTSGIGIVPDLVDLSPSNVKVGDKIILSGTIADHGIAVLSARENLSFESEIKSDTAPLNDLVDKMLSVTKNIHVLRDPTRGGLATTLNEISSKAGVGIQINQDKIKIKNEVKAACELLGLDPLYIANEGKLVCFVSPEDADSLLAEMRNHPLGIDSENIGEVTNEFNGKVILKTTIGTKRILDLHTIEQLPRIC